MSVQIKGLRGPSGEFGALGVVELSCSAADVFRFVADVEQQPEWNHGVKQSKVLKSTGNVKSVQQVLQWNFLALRGDMHLQLAQHEDPKALTIRTELTGGTMMRNFRSRVGVREKAPGKCELEMEMFMQPNIFVPFGIRHMVGGQVRRQLKGVLSALQDRFEAQQRVREQQELERASRRSNLGGLKLGGLKLGGLNLGGSNLGGSNLGPYAFAGVGAAWGQRDLFGLPQLQLRLHPWWVAAA